ncbi:MAG: hypothetical protein HYZ17_17555 [Betaproteobacteria bacterium]|nr:hypothetical protein [Betaproteobacteria bacterium]
MWRGALAPLLLAALAPITWAATAPGALSDAEIVAMCRGAEHREHCGRLVEAEQLRRNPDLATRQGRRLDIKLNTGAGREFLDREGGADGKTPDRAVSIWAYDPRNDFLTLWVQEGERSYYLLMNRETGLTVETPAEPVGSPDHLRFAVADFCEQHCRNEITLWEVQIHRLRRARTLQPAAPWADAEVSWKDRHTLAIEAKRHGPAGPSMNYFEIDLGDARWKFHD